VILFLVVSVIAIATAQRTKDSPLQSHHSYAVPATNSPAGPAGGGRKLYAPWIERRAGSAVSLYRSKFPEWLPSAVQINRHNLDLLCNSDCGAVGKVAPQEC